MTDLGDVLTKLGEKMKDKIKPSSKVYYLANLQKLFETYGLEGNPKKYTNVNVVIPLVKASEDGIHADGNSGSLSGYAQLKSGIAVPEWVAEESGLSYKEYKPKKRMILDLG